jgi:hypothetical protein
MSRISSVPLLLMIMKLVCVCKWKVSVVKWAHRVNGHACSAAGSGGLWSFGCITLKPKSLKQTLLHKLGSIAVSSVQLEINAGHVVAVWCCCCQNLLLLLPEALHAVTLRRHSGGSTFGLMARMLAYSPAAASAAGAGTHV